MRFFPRYSRLYYHSRKLVGISLWFLLKLSWLWLRLDRPHPGCFYLLYTLCKNMWGSERPRKCLGPNILPFHFLRGHINIYLIFGVIYIYQEFSPHDFWMGSTKTEHSCSQTTLDSRISDSILVEFSRRPQSHIFSNMTELKSSPGFHSAWSWWSQMGTGDTWSLWLLTTHGVQSPVTVG